MNKVFTKEQIEALKFMEKDFHTVLDLKYKRNNTRAEMEKVASIYEEATNEKIKKDWACNVCLYNIVAKVGELYRKSIAYWAENEEVKEVKEEIKVKEAPKKSRSDKKSSK